MWAHLHVFWLKMTPKVAVKDNYPEQNDPLKTGI